MSVVSKKPILTGFSQYEAKRGDRITVYGTGFLPINNTIVFDDTHKIENVIGDATSTTFTIPDALPNGEYSISVLNSNGTTKDGETILTFMVSDTPKSLPTITDITPKQMQFAKGGSITITGSGFEQAGNTIYTSIGIVANLSSADGKTLIIPLSSFPSASELAKNAKNFIGINLPVTIRVGTKVGGSKDSAQFLLQF